MSPVVCKIEVQQACALVRGSLRRLLALFRLSQTCLRLFVHVAENPNKAHVVPARWDQILKPMPPFLYRYPNRRETGLTPAAVGRIIQQDV
jgi:hypothetical protein